MPSVRKIAEAADVSIGTVSRVLNNQPHVSPAVRARVLKAVNEMRDADGVGIRKSSSSIALLYRGQSSLYSAFDSALLHGVAEELNQTEHDLMVINAAKSRGPGETLGQMLVRRGVAGVLLRTTTMTHVMCEELATERFPAVAIADEVTNKHIGCVHGDATNAIERALEHLVALGHRKIAVALHVVDDFDHTKRLDTFRSFVSRHGLPTDDRWLIRSPATVAGGGAVLKQLMMLVDRPTAIFMIDPVMGVGLSIEAMRLGVKIPQDLSVVGFDDTGHRHAAYPMISSVCQDAEGLGRLAVQHLLEVVDRRSTPRHISLECFFEPLESTAPPSSEGAVSFPHSQSTSASGHQEKSQRC